MSASDLKFVIFRDLKDGYRWRLSSPTGETLEYSSEDTAIRMSASMMSYRLKDDQYPYARVRDATIG